MQIRPFVASDEAGLVGWLPSPPRNPFIVHGPDRDPGDGQWSRTLVAELAGDVVGAATVVEHRLHKQRYPCTLDVLPAVRRQGVGTALVRGLGQILPEACHLDARIRTDDEAGYGFCRAIGFAPYVECPLWRLDLTISEVVAWMGAQTPPSDVQRMSLADASDEQVLDLWVANYEWIHAGWSPICSRERAREVLAEGLAMVDREASTVALRAGEPAALALVIESVVIAETMRRDEPGGERLVACTISATLRALAGRGVTHATFDGHTVDPHLPTVLRDLPTTSDASLLFMELSSIGDLPPMPDR